MDMRWLQLYSDEHLRKIARWRLGDEMSLERIHEFKRWGRSNYASEGYKLRCLYDYDEWLGQRIMEFGN